MNGNVHGLPTTVPAAAANKLLFIKYVPKKTYYYISLIKVKETVAHAKPTEIDSGGL